MSNARNIANIPNGDDAPVYACRAWVNFRGTSQSGTLNTSGPVTGLYTATVTGATTFTIEYSSTTYTVTTYGNHEVGDGEGVDLTISGTSVTIDTQIRESGNVSSITYNGTGHQTINFTNAMQDANYSAVVTNDLTSNGGWYVVPYLVSFSTTSLQYRNNSHYNLSSGDCIQICIAVFR